MATYPSTPSTNTVHSGGAIRARVLAAQSEHQAIIRDVLAAADFWGGTRSPAWKDFMSDLGRNFEVIYDQCSSVRMPVAPTAADSEVSVLRKRSASRLSPLGRWWPGSTLAH